MSVAHGRGSVGGWIYPRSGPRAALRTVVDEHVYVDVCLKDMVSALLYAALEFLVGIRTLSRDPLCPRSGGVVWQDDLQLLHCVGYDVLYGWRCVVEVCLRCHV